MTKPKSTTISAKADFEEVEHTADWALRIRGRDLDELLTHAALGMSSLLVAEPANIPLNRAETIEVEACDAESLLVNWLSELAYRAEAEGIVFGEFELQQVTPTHLLAIVRGGCVTDLQKHIKAVTYHNLEIVKTTDGLEVTVVFDV
ncbi:MAG: archease [Anaerolineae bacterium]|nr:archease [Anaerolineae bacterium]